MKNFLILTLSLLLVVGAFMSRPTEEQFHEYMRHRADGVAPSSKDSPDDDDSLTQGCDYKDRYLWSEVEVNGKSLYAGVFSQWFQIPTSLPSAPPLMPPTNSAKHFNE